MLLGRRSNRIRGKPADNDRNIRDDHRHMRRSIYPCRIAGDRNQIEKRLPTLSKFLHSNRGLLVFLFGMLLMRSAFANWYVVPSSSMYPNLLEGDRVLCNRLAYDFKLPFTDVILTHLGNPQRGDIVTFSSPEDGVRLVKRLIAIPGDVVEMREEQLIVNGVAASYAPSTPPDRDHLSPDYRGRQFVLQENLGRRSSSIIVMPDRDALRSFGPVTVPAGEYMMLGDNRDNSKDSRYIGMVRRELLTGRVRHVLFSLNPANHYLPRLKRLGAPI
jgi:signal peptidase I